MNCEKHMWKWIFIMLTYANMNMKTSQGYNARLCLKMVLNRLKETKGLGTPIYTPLGT
jgi:hypothetical protein